MAISKVEYGSDVLMDLTGDTVDAAHLAEGYTAHDKSGEVVEGAARFGNGAYDVSQVTMDDGTDQLVITDATDPPPSGSVTITTNGTHDVKQYEEAVVDVPTGVDTSSDTVTVYDLYKGVTAHDANGDQITGGLIGYSAVINRNDTNCSATELVYPCPFQPKLITISLLSAVTSSSDANTVIDLMVWRLGAFGGINAATSEYYCGHSVGSYTSGKFEVLKHQTDISNDSSIFTWDGTNVHIKSPSSTYKFSTKNYRLISIK